MDGQGSGGEQPGKLESQTLSQGNHESGWERQIAAVQSLCDRRESAIVRVELFGVILGEACLAWHDYIQMVSSSTRELERSRDRCNTVSYRYTNVNDIVPFEQLKGKHSVGP